MATRKFSSELRRRCGSHLSLHLSQSRTFSNPNLPPASARQGFLTSLSSDRTGLRSLLPFSASFRCFSSGASEAEVPDLIESKLQSVTLNDAPGYLDPSVGDALVHGDYILPIRVAISALDWIHDSTGLPWWLTIASSALMLRVSLLPLLFVQQHKLKTIGECFPKLPPPFPPPFSGKSYVEQFSRFRRERKAIGCPSLLWFLAYFSVQVPCFVLCMGSIRRMSLDHHAGFDVGGALWFQNLTEFAQGAPGFIFPTLIAGFHLLNVQLQLSNRPSKVGRDTGLFGSLEKYYKFYLRAVTVPIFIAGFLVPHKVGTSQGLSSASLSRGSQRPPPPCLSGQGYVLQGSLVYWVNNSSLNIIQHLCLQNPTIRAKLGLPQPREQDLVSTKEPGSDPGSASSESTNNKRKVPVKDLSPKELLGLSVLSLSRGNQDGAIPLLRLALQKDPEYVRALTVMGQTLLQRGQEVEAIEYLERAISKLSHAGLPTEVEDLDLFIQASQWAGVAYIRQGKPVEGRVHLERVASVEEPEDAKSKVHYYDGLALLSSALLNEGRKTEAIKYLQKAAAFNPEFNNFLEQCKKESGDIVSTRKGNR